MIAVVGDIVVQFAFWSAVAFILGYTLLASWWKTEIGWARISLDFGIALALSPAIIEVWAGPHFSENAWVPWFDISAVAFVGCVSLWNLALVARKQVKGLRKGKDDTTARQVRRSPARPEL